MIERNLSAIIISASSDIGAALCRRWKAYGREVYGTYRNKSRAVEELTTLGIKLVYCDLLEAESIENACSELRMLVPEWDILVLCPGTQEPVGNFDECKFEEWEKSIQINFTSQMGIVRTLLPYRSSKSPLGPCVLFFAGGGTNSAPVRYSAYTVSKISLIKMCELLDAEIPDTRFAIIGPGWIKTKIHDSTLKAGAKAGDNYGITLDKLSGNKCTPMEEVLKCLDWIIEKPRELIGGRNFSVVFDMWGTEELENSLLRERDMYKLRRFGNDWNVRNT